MAMRARTWHTCALALIVLGGVASTGDAGDRPRRKDTAQGWQPVPAAADISMSPVRPK